MGTLSGELHEEHLRNARAKAQQAVHAGRKVIVAGTMAHTMPENIRRHPFIEYWFADGGLGRFSIPSSAGFVLHSKYIQHNDVNRLKEEAYKKGIDFSVYPFTTGDLREILQPLGATPEPPKLLAPSPEPSAPPAPVVEVVAVQPPVPADPPMETVPVSTPSPVFNLRRSLVKRGELKSFVLRHADLTAKQVIVEARRLHVLAQRQPGLAKTTPESIAQSIYNIRSEQKAAASVKATAARPAPAPVETDDVLKLAKDAVAAINLMAERYVQMRDKTQRSDALVAKVMADFAKLAN